MKATTQTRFLVLCLGWAAVGLSACELAIGNSDLVGVECDQPGQVGAPSCGEGQVCAKGVCTACRSGEVCSNGVDDDCNGKIDDSCGTGGSDGGPWSKDGDNPDVSVVDGDTGVVTTGGAAGSAGTGGAGGTGGAAGEGGAAGSAGSTTGGSAGTAGSTGTGGAAGQGGTTAQGGSGGSCSPNDAICDPGNHDCCIGNCCTVSVNFGHCGNELTQWCDSDDDCCSGKCALALKWCVLN
jgi:hypothetical protein